MALGARRSRKLRSWGEDGVSILEYVLLVSLVALVGVGALLYLGRSSASPGHAANAVAVGVSGGAGTSPGPRSRVWCTTSSSDCTDAVSTGDQQVVSFWVTAGTPDYSFQLGHRVPGFVTLQDVDKVAGTGKVIIEPKSCAEAGTYDIALLVTDAATPPGSGQLSFSLTVSKSSTC